MLLSRFWYIFLAVAATVGVGAGLLAQGIINQQREDELAEALRRDRFAIEAVLRLEARNRLDRIAFITVDNKFGALLRQAGSTQDSQRLREIGGEVKELMRSQTKRLVEAGGPDNKERLEPDIAFALDRDGRIVAQLGPLEANPPGASLATYPLVRKALQGYIRDDVWVYDRRVYRMAARPVVSGSEYAGAIVHGYRMDDSLAEQLSLNLDGASVGFFFGTRMLGAHTPEGHPTQAEMAAPLEGVLKDDDFAQGKRTQPIALESGGRATYSLAAGSAAQVNVGYVIARPRSLLASPLDLFSAASQQDLDRLPKVPLAGGLCAAALIGLMFVWLERDRPFKRLAQKTAEISAGSRERLIVTEWSGGYRRLADNINQALDKTAERAQHMAPTSKQKANLDEILGPTPDSAGEPFFGFASDADQGGAARDPFNFDAPAGGPPRSPAPSRPSPLPPKPAPPARPAPASALGGPPPPAPPPVAAPKPAAKAAPPPARPAAPAASAPTPGFDEAAHFQDVFGQYVATRQECGEPTESLTFEKFEQTLKKTRDQLVSKHGAKAVKFTVYVKQGKAALKASPIKA